MPSTAIPVTLQDQLYHPPLAHAPRSCERSSTCDCNAASRAVHGQRHSNACPRQPQTSKLLPWCDSVLFRATLDKPCSHRCLPKGTALHVELEGGAHSRMHREQRPLLKAKQYRCHHYHHCPKLCCRCCRLSLFSFAEDRHCGIGMAFLKNIPELRSHGHLP